MLAGCAPAALKPVATAASIIVEEKEELGALEKTLVPMMQGSFQELYEDDRWCTKNARFSDSSVQGLWGPLEGAFPVPKAVLKSKYRNLAPLADFGTAHPADS
jgi:hypothetical protein